MIINREDAQRIARELIAKIVTERIDTPVCRYVEENGSHIFVFTLPYIPAPRYMGTVDFPAVTSTFRFNPLTEATEIVVKCAFNLQAVSDPSMSDFMLRRDSKERIRQMLKIAADVFMDAMWQARIIAQTQCHLETMRTIGRPDLARELLNSTLALIEERLRERLGKISHARNPKINDTSISTALKAFLPKFRKTGAIPSQRQFAKTIGVTPKGWRDFLKSRHFDKHELTIKEWLEYMVASDSEPEEWLGSISEVVSPHGD